MKIKFQKNLAAGLSSESMRQIRGGEDKPEDVDDTLYAADGLDRSNRRTGNCNYSRKCPNETMTQSGDVITVGCVYCEKHDITATG